MPEFGADRTVPIGSLVLAGSPRLAGEDDAHVRVLADTDAALPPILAHRPSMRVIDGRHRVRAALLRGEEEIRARFFDGDDAEAFLLSVSENVAHGLPLSRSDRAAAVERILRHTPEWSDRAIADATGLSARTVADIRRRATAGTPQSHTRIGRDGRRRPVDPAAGRRRVGELLAANPDASLREIARAAGVSPGTVRSVKERLRAAPEEPPPVADPGALISRLRQDPSVRFNEANRALLRLLDAHASTDHAWPRFASQLPEHCTELVRTLARRYAHRWAELAEELDR
ncbi:ParB N-terminal domain-containing protein [Saccharothrix violaceirubra]|uniref:ParB-like chromosome segregation protein Spo0J n=1 Tax=Saccharothrix violaceirubra TaxID=413306 RepID=A0A7W7T783_9PSEU|nr:helix-turn-helix domain-containing protein [Saccharothrix violaceirubra]MBB4966525.1 ParB-like chromosome segregation protein Spo0J [Saccharothrix violaceirubra]